MQNMEGSLISFTFLRPPYDEFQGFLMILNWFYQGFLITEDFENQTLLNQVSAWKGVKFYPIYTDNNSSREEKCPTLVLSKPEMVWQWNWGHLMPSKNQLWIFKMADYFWWCQHNIV